jgi:hypothetical protein
MSFAAPIWLLALLPWAAITLWLLIGKRKRVDVPFLDLWEGPDQGERTTRLLHIPPLALAIALLAILLTIFAAATPRVAGSGANAPITVLVDRGATMPPQRVEPLLRELNLPHAHARFVNVPDTSAPTGLDTRAMLQHAITEQLARSDEPVVVVTDQPLNRQDDRVIQVAPSQPAQNVGIIRIAVREKPAPQVMVRLRNQLPLTSAKLRITTAGNAAERTIDLPPTDVEKDYFIDVPAFGHELAIELEAPDDLPADNRAWLVRERNWPRVEIREPVSPAIRHLVGVYARLRPPGEGSHRVAIVRDAKQLAPEGPGVIAGASTQSGDAKSLENVRTQDHPILNGVTWPPSALLANNPPAGFTPIATSGDRVLVATRSEPSRQVWVGIDDDEWARSPDFVVFWTNVLDWAGEGTGEQFVAHPVGQLGAEWSPVESTADDAKRPPGLWPGLYRRSPDGALRAMNALDVRVGSLSDVPDWHQRLTNLSRTTGVLDLAPWAAVLAVACLLVSAAAWARRRLTAFSKPLTV